MLESKLSRSEYERVILRSDGEPAISSHIKMAVNRLLLERPIDVLQETTFQSRQCCQRLRRRGSQGGQGQ
eukprot:6121278-Karenia_brevis.AAC.1